MTAFLGKTTTDVPHSSSEGTQARGCKNPFENTRFCRNAVQHYRIIGVFVSRRFFLATVKPKIAETCC